MRKSSKRRGLAAILSAGILFQFGGCNFATVTVPTTLDGTELLITLIRGAILSPIDQAITAAVQNAFNNDDDE